MEKSICLSEYKRERYIHPNYTHRELINSAWKKTDKGMKHNNRKRAMVMTFKITGALFVGFIVISSLTASAASASDLLDFKIIKVNEPDLWSKIKNINDIFWANCRGLDIQQSEEFLYAIAKPRLAPDEFGKVKELFEYLPEESYTELFRMLDFCKLVK